MINTIRIILIGVILAGIKIRICVACVCVCVSWICDIVVRICVILIDIIGFRRYWIGLVISLIICIRICSCARIRIIRASCCIIWIYFLAWVIRVDIFVRACTVLIRVICRIDIVIVLCRLSVVLSIYCLLIGIVIRVDTVIIRIIRSSIVISSGIGIRVVAKII